MPYAYAHFWRGQSHNALMRFGESIEDMSLAIESGELRQKEEALAYFYLAVSDGDEDTEGSIENFTKAIELGVEDEMPQVYYHRGHLYSLLARYTEARADLTAFLLNLQVNPNPPHISQTLALLGRIAFHEKRYEVAIDHLRDSLNLFPGYLPPPPRLAEIRYYLGISLYQVNRHEEARVHLGETLEDLGHYLDDEKKEEIRRILEEIASGHVSAVI